MDPVQKKMLDIFLLVFLSSPLQPWLKTRGSKTLKTLNEITSEPKPEYGFLYNARSYWVPRLVDRLVGIGGSPPYLSDVHPKRVCKRVLVEGRDEDGGVGELLRETFYEEKTKELLEAEGGKLGSWEVFSSHSFNDDEKFFWGGIGSSSYPLHRDLNDADAIFTMYEGCKEFVIVDPKSRGLLTRVDVPGFNIWLENLFEGWPSRDRVGRGWTGTVRAGETLYMPGEMLHEVRNNCVHSISMCRRPWRASSVRNITEESRVLLHEATLAKIRERSWLFWAMGYLSGGRQEEFTGNMV